MTTEMTREDRRARQDVQALKEMSLRIQANPSVAELFNTYLLTLIGRFRLTRAAVYVPSGGTGEFRLFLSKGHFLGRDLPDRLIIRHFDEWTSDKPLIFLNDEPRLDPGNVLKKMGLSFTRVLSWQSAGSLRQALVYMGSRHAIPFSAADEIFIDLISRHITNVLSGPAGEVLNRLQDLERRSDLVKSAGRTSPGDGRTKDRLLDSRNFQTLQDIAMRFKGGVSLPEMFNTYLLTLLGRLRLKRAAVYVSTLPASRFKRLLWKGKWHKGNLPEFIDAPEIPVDRLWVNLKEHPALNRGNVFGRIGFSVAWILTTGAARKSNPETATVLVYMGADQDIQLSPADIKFMEILNTQMRGILNLLDSFSQSGRGTMLDWDKSFVSLMQETLLDQLPSSKDRLHYRILFRPSHKVGGDFYDFYRFGDGVIGVAVADVVGHGIPAAMWTYAIRDHLRQIVSGDAPPEPARALELLNALLVKNQKSEIPVSVCYGILNLNDASFTYASAGIDYPLLLRPAESQIFELPAGGLFLGCLPDIHFSQETVQLKEEDILVIYTDGLQPASHAGWRDQWLSRLKGNAKLDIAEHLMEELADSPDAPDDDKTALLFSPMAGPRQAEAAAKHFHRLTIPSDVRHLPTLRIFLENILRSFAPAADAGDTAFAVGFTTEDAVVNSIQHGYPGLPDGRVTIEAGLDLPGKDRLSITVSDRGRGFHFDPDRIPKFTTEEELYRSNGRGLYMMYQLMDEVRIDSRVSAGTTVTLVKYLGKEKPNAA